MAAFVDKHRRPASAAGWLDRLSALLAQELAPSPRRLWTSLRLTTIAIIGTALIAICHVNNQLGTYIVWLLVGAGPMMSARKAGDFLAAEGIVLACSVVMARAFAETPWFMLPFLFAFMALSTFIGVTRELGTGMLLIQVVSLGSFYGVVFAPREIGWAAAGAFGGTAIALGVIILFDNWLWPDRADPILMASLGAAAAHERSRLLEASKYYFDHSAVRRPPEPPPTSGLPDDLALLNRAVAEGATSHRQAVLLAALTRAARIHVEVDRLIVAARENVPRGIRAMLRPEMEAAVDAIASALDEIAREAPTIIRVGPDQPPPPAAARARSVMDALNARVMQMTAEIGRADAAELANSAAFNDCLGTLTRFIERPLDEPPSDATSKSPARALSEATITRDPALLRHCLKVGFCTVIGYVIGLAAQRPELSVILTSILITALPNYGAALRKMILRIVGALLGGLISLLMIIIVTPNFETLPAYMFAIFIVLYLSAYSSLSSGRVAYAGKQIGTTFVLVFAGLSPSADIYGPLWRIWGILLGTLIVTVVYIILRPVYAGDSLMPRLRKVIRDALALTPGGSASSTEADIETANSETMRLLAEILAVADDAQLEGRSSMVDHDSIVQAAGTLRRIANRLAGISMGRTIVAPPLDDGTESAREAVLAAIRARLEAWLDFFEGRSGFISDAGAVTAPPGHSDSEITAPLDQFSRRLEAQGFAQISAWTLDQRRAILAELQSMRRLRVLMLELDRYLAGVARPTLKLGHVTT
jgi:hypothetical protein